jgi:hypothetical protein
MSPTTANAAPVVTFYTDEASFLAAIFNPTVLNFEGIALDAETHDFGPSYHTGAVTFTSPGNHMLVVGKQSFTLGAPFDSALLIPESEPSTLIATFDPGSNVTAIGGFFSNLFTRQELAGLTLTGSSGVLDQRWLPLGIATKGAPKTFLGYTVVGDAVTGLSVESDRNSPAFDDFTYGTALPEPASVSLLLIGGIGLLARRRGA